jgi:hypothetical protein
VNKEWKGQGRKPLGPNLPHCPDISPEGLKKITQDFNHDSRQPPLSRFELRNSRRRESNAACSACNFTSVFASDS